MEQIPEQFNIEKFEQTLKNILDEYFTNYLSVSGLGLEGSEYQEFHKSTFTNLINEIVPILTDTLKSQQNKQGIFEVLHRCIEEVGSEHDYDEMENPFSKYEEVSLLEAIILRLLK